MTIFFVGGDVPNPEKSWWFMYTQKDGDMNPSSSSTLQGTFQKHGTHRKLGFSRKRNSSTQKGAMMAGMGDSTKKSYNGHP